MCVCVVFVGCFGPQESANAIEATVVATVQGMALCPEDATAINNKLAALPASYAALCAMCRAC